MCRRSCFCFGAADARARARGIVAGRGGFKVDVSLQATVWAAGLRMWEGGRAAAAAAAAACARGVVKKFLTSTSNVIVSNLFESE